MSEVDGHPAAWHTEEPDDGPAVIVEISREEYADPLRVDLNGYGTSEIVAKGVGFLHSDHEPVQTRSKLGPDHET